MQCHPERSGCFAERSRCGVEGPLVSGVAMNAERRFHEAAKWKFPARMLPGSEPWGSFDCVIVRVANDHFAQDDNE